MAKHFELTRVPDGMLLELASSMLACDEEGSCSFQAADGISLAFGSGQDLSPEWGRVFGASSYLISDGSISLPTFAFTFEFHRGRVFRARENYGAQWMPLDNPFIDGIGITGPSKGDCTLDLLLLVNRFVSLAPPINLSSDGSSALDRSTLILNRISDAAAGVVEYTAARQRDLDVLQSTLEDRARETVERETARLNNLHDTAMKALDARADGLGEKERALDDRSNTHVRRELQGKMAGIATEALAKPLLASSNPSFQLTVLVAVGTASILILLASLQSISLARDNVTGSLLWFGEARVLTLGLFAATLILYALRVSSARHRQISRWEHDLHKFRLDTECASFLIEGELEARRNNGQVLPEVVLDRFSRGLFTSAGGDHDAEGGDVGSTFAHLVNRAASLKIGPGGTEIEVKQGGIKRANKDAAKDAGDDE